MCLLFILAPVAAVMVGYWIVRPLHVSRGAALRVRRFTLLDFFALAIQLQMGLGLAMALREEFRDRAPGNLLLSAIVATIGVLVVWLAGLRAAGDARVTEWKRRLAMHVVLLPGTIGVMIAIGAGLVMLAASDDRLLLSWSFLLAGCSLVGAWTLRQLATWIVRPQTE